MLMAIGPANLPRLQEIAVDWRTLMFGLALSVLSGLLFGLIPALKYGRSRGTALSRAVAGRTTSASRERHRARNILVVGQVAMALVLLVCAGLMIRTFNAIRNVQPGFTDARTLQLMEIAIPSSLIAEPDGAAFSDQVLICQGEKYARVIFKCGEAGDASGRRCCPRCGAEHMACHIGYCDAEECPKCAGQLIACGCFPDRMPPWTRAIYVH